MSTLGDRIKELRKEFNLTQKELGEKLNVGKSTISQYENNINTPDIEIIRKISQIFDVSVDYLLANTEIRNNFKIPDLFNAPGKLDLSSIKKMMMPSKNNNNLLFSLMLEEKLKEANLYNDNMSDEEKIELANKILDILKLIKNK